MRLSCSVVIPVYNGSDHVVPAIRSVLSQTMEPHEIIVVDDASTDDTLAVLEQFGDRIHIIAQPTNAGASKARNVGIGAATGDVIAFLDSDDEWYPDKLEAQ